MSIKCFYCGKFIPYKDFEDKKAGWIDPGCEVTAIDPPDPEPVCRKCKSQEADHDSEGSGG